MAREPFNKVWAENPDGTGPNTFQQPDDTRLEKGWVGGASGTPPKAGEENWWHNRVDVAMQQIERFGVMDWHVGAIYGIGGRARGSDGKFYLSLSTPNEANDPTTDDGSNWVEDLGPGQNIAVFDAAGVTEWTVPEVLKQGLRKALVTVIGGGGGGSRGGAGAGGMSEGIVDLAGVASISVTVGDGGAGTDDTAQGGSGESSSFGALISATGGSGGQTGSNQRSAGGAGAGGDINYLGGEGAAANGAGFGGSIIGGPAPSRAGSGTGSNGTTYGGGGGGAAVTGEVGGAGHRGIVIVRW